MIDPVSLIVAALGQALMAMIHGAASEAGRDAYGQLKGLVVSRYGHPVQQSIEAMEAHPADPRSRAVVERTLRQAGAAADPDVAMLAQRLLAILDDPGAISGELVAKVDPVENLRRVAGVRSIRQILDGHVGRILDVRSRIRVNDTDLLVQNVNRQTHVPEGARRDIVSLHHRIRVVVEQIAAAIESGRTRETRQRLVQIQSYQDRERAGLLIDADERLRISYETLRLTVEFYGELNEGVLQRIEQARDPQSELNRMFGNAVLMFELADFVIRYVKDFSLGGMAELERLHRDVMLRVDKARHDQQQLVQMASQDAVEPAVRDAILGDVRSRGGAIDAVVDEWAAYMRDTRKYYERVDAVRGRVPTLEVIRENARIQINVLEFIAMLRLLKQTSAAVRATVETLQGFRLAPLTTNRVQRLLSI